MDPVILPIGVAVIIMQFFLSKKANKIFGLILPVASLVFSIIICLWFLMFGMVGTQYRISTTDGNVHTFLSVAEANEFKETIDPNTIISDERITDGSEKSTFSSIVLPAIRLFTGVNLITLILLLIYHHNRKYRRNSQLQEIQKMSIKDF